MSAGALDQTAHDLVREALRRSATLGVQGRLVCVDGPAASGKTTLAAAMGRVLRDTLRPPGGVAQTAHVRTLHMDNLYDGWTGLETGMTSLARDVLEPLSRDEPGRYRRYDWHRGRFAEERTVLPCRVLLVEGVGSGGALSSGVADLRTLLVWVQAPDDVRRTRWDTRGGAQMARHWQQWRDQEAAMFERERIRQRADVVVDTAGECEAG